MQKLLRRIRGSIGMGLTWGAVWSIAGMAMNVATRFQADAPFPLVFFVAGFLAGNVFSVLLALAEGRRRLDELSLKRFASWGAVGGLGLSVVLSQFLFGFAEFGVIAPAWAAACALSASGSLALARRAALRELPDSSAKSPDELTFEEQRQLQ